jgi:hypothetical protein
MKISNPQGKGLVPMLQAWQDLGSAAPVARSQRRWLLDYLAGSLVLAAELRFKPTVGRDYYLYWRDGKWSLSMVAPEEWGADHIAHAVAVCRLQADLSWALSPVSSAPLPEEVIAALEAFQHAFLAHIDSDRLLVEGLPFYSASLPWHARILGLGLSKTLQVSLRQLPANRATGRQLLAAVDSIPRLLP